MHESCSVVNRSSQQLEITEGIVLVSATEIQERHEIIVQEKDGVIEVNVTKLMVEPGDDVAVTLNDSQTQTLQEGMEHTCMDEERVGLPAEIHNSVKEFISWMELGVKQLLK